jgi:hypothetical protein
MRWALIQAGRVANVVEQADKPTIPGNWVACGNAGPGWVYDEGSGAFGNPNVVAPPSWTDPALDPRYYWLDIGPFFDRFGTKALALTSSTDAQIQGVITLVMPRKYIDLKRADLSAMLDLLISKGAITLADKLAALNPVTTDAERHIKGLPQPV